MCPIPSRVHPKFVGYSSLEDSLGSPVYSSCGSPCSISDSPMQSLYVSCIRPANKRLISFSLIQLTFLLPNITAVVGYIALRETLTLGEVLGGCTTTPSCINVTTHFLISYQFGRCCPDRSTCLHLWVEHQNSGRIIIR